MFSRQFKEQICEVDPVRFFLAIAALPCAQSPAPSFSPTSLGFDGSIVKTALRHLALSAPAPSSSTLLRSPASAPREPGERPKRPMPLRAPARPQIPHNRRHKQRTAKPSQPRLLNQLRAPPRTHTAAPPRPSIEERHQIQLVRG